LFEKIAIAMRLFISVKANGQLPLTSQYIIQSQAYNIAKASSAYHTLYEYNAIFKIQLQFI